MTRSGVVLLAGGASAAGQAVARELHLRGTRSIIASRSAAELPPADSTTCATVDLTDPTDVAALRATLNDQGVAVDRIVHLVGGWAGGRDIPGQSEERYAMLAASFTALRNVTREFHPDLCAAQAPRLISVSSPLAHTPSPNSANYASVKAATEAWTLAVNASLRAATPEGAGVVVVTDGLAEREESFARLVADLMEAPADRVAGVRVRHI
ncbi:SDR family NAD(P)-dependent oxidoreductase [Leucobacter chromiireducens]|uniref:SDR family NAD(P)-dependent oxidoreductase n=1 Tax=Leucobacter chromiireducens TaxID=283877 RepID=UPI0013DE3936|nr:SDR family oxidoreductase [Leucobacter chromiireducens]